MSEIGTLKELNVQPGDVVKNMISNIQYDVDPNMCVGGAHVDACVNQYLIISRAKPAIDLTANTSAWGLCSDEWRAAMQAHMNAGGEFEWYCANGTWSKRNTPINDPPLYGIYRAKPGPVVTTRVIDGFARDFADVGFWIGPRSGDDRAPGPLTITFHDGKPVKAEWVAT